MEAVALICSKCGTTHRRVGQKYCRDCHAGYMRDWRKTHPLSPEARKRDAARSHANVGKRRGALIPRPCQKCGAAETEMHHPDYELPRDIVWLCRSCHLSWHAHFRGVVIDTFSAWLVPATAVELLPSAGEGEI